MVHRAIFSYLQNLFPILIVLFLIVSLGLLATFAKQSQDNRQRACEWITTSCGSGCADYFATRPECTREGGGTPATSEPVPGSPGEGCDNGVSVGGTACRNQGEPRQFKCQPGSRPGASIWQEEVCSGNGTCQGTACTTTAQTTGTGTVVAPATCDSSGDTAYSCRGKTVGHDNGGCTCQITSGSVCGCIPTSLVLANGLGCLADQNCQSGNCESGRCTARTTGGTACRQNSECESGSCVSNVCSGATAVPPVTAPVSPATCDAACTYNYDQCRSNGAVWCGIANRCYAASVRDQVDCSHAFSPDLISSQITAVCGSCRAAEVTTESQPPATRTCADLTTRALCTASGDGLTCTWNATTNTCTGTGSVAASCPEGTQTCSCSTTTNLVCADMGMSCASLCGESTTDARSCTQAGGDCRVNGSNAAGYCVSRPNGSGFNCSPKLGAGASCNGNGYACQTGTCTSQGCSNSACANGLVSCNLEIGNGCNDLKTCKEGLSCQEGRCVTIAVRPPADPPRANISCSIIEVSNWNQVYTQSSGGYSCTEQNMTLAACDARDATARSRVSSTESCTQLSASWLQSLPRKYYFMHILGDTSPLGGVCMSCTAASHDCYGSPLFDSVSSCQEARRLELSRDLTNTARTPPSTACWDLNSEASTQEAACTFGSAPSQADCTRRNGYLTQADCFTAYSRAARINSQEACIQSCPMDADTVIRESCIQVCRNSFPILPPACTTIQLTSCRTAGFERCERTGENFWNFRCISGRDRSTAQMEAPTEDSSLLSSSCSYRGIPVLPNEQRCFEGEPTTVLSCPREGGQINVSFCESGMACENGECEPVANVVQAATCFYGSSSCSAFGRVSVQGCVACSTNLGACCGGLIATVAPTSLVCRPLARSCSNVTTAKTCNQDGRGWTEVQCREGNVCIGGICINPNQTSSCSCEHRTDTDEIVQLPVSAASVGWDNRCYACLGRANGSCGLMRIGDSCAVELLTPAEPIDGLGQLQEQYPTTRFYVLNSPGSTPHADTIRSVSTALDLLPPEIITEGATYVLGEYSQSAGGASLIESNINYVGNPPCSESYTQNPDVDCGYGISIVLHETLHPYMETVICEGGVCTTLLERFVEASEQDGVIFTSEVSPESQVTHGDDFLLYTQYATNDVEGFAISGAAYVLAPDELERNQPEVYAFYRDQVFQGREYIEILNFGCQTSRIEIKNAETIRLQQEALDGCSK